MTTLDELRRANLQEQRRSAQSDPPTPATPGAPAAQDPAPAVASTPVVTERVDVTRVVASTPSDSNKAVPESLASEPVSHSRENGHAHPAPKAKASVEAAPSEPVDDLDPYTRKSRAVMDRFYRGLARKVIHPTGVKATVDMPPELFWRVKRYCHDHNNVTVRQLFLDLVSALLDEEGY